MTERTGSSNHGALAVGASRQREECDPVEHVQIARLRLWPDPAFARDALPRPFGDPMPQRAGERQPRPLEPRLHQREVPRSLVRWKERQLAPGDAKKPGVDGGNGLERSGRQTAREGELPPRQPAERGERARPDGRSFAGRLVLDDEVGANERRRWIVEQPVQDRRRQGERNVADDPERFLGHRHLKDVAFDHCDVRSVVEPPPEHFREGWIELDGDDASSRPRQGLGEAPRARADLDHQIVGRDGGLGDQFASKRAAPKEVPTARPRCVRP